MPSLFEIGFWGDVENVKNLQRDRYRHTDAQTDTQRTRQTNNQKISCKLSAQVS